MDTGAKQPIKPDGEVWYVQFKSGKEFGPVSQNTWVQWYREGRIDSQTPVTTTPPTVDISRRPWMLIGPLLKHFNLDQDRHSDHVTVAKSSATCCCASKRR